MAYLLYCSFIRNSNELWNDLLMQRKEIFLFILLLALTLQPSLCELNSASIQIKKDQEEIKHCEAIRAQIP
jgi:hypothetical protein